MIDIQDIQSGQRLAKLIHSISGSKKRYDSLILSLSLNNTTFGTFSKILDRKLKSDEGLVIIPRRLFGDSLSSFDIEVLSSILDKVNLSIVPIYSKMEDKTLAVLLVIHRKLYRALEYQKQILDIIKPSANLKSQFVGTAIKVSEEITHLTDKVTSISIYDMIDALNLLSNDEVYYISYNFLILTCIEPNKAASILADKKFYVDILKSDVLRQTEKNPAYKDIAEIAGLLISKTEAGIISGRNNLDILFKCSEHIDKSFKGKLDESI